MTVEACKSCGSLNFKEGVLGSEQAHVYEVNKISIFKKHSKLITKFCLECGEVASFRVENPGIFKNK
ncbi:MULTISPECIES: hypothetical protein [Bacillus]|uniref:hypothetical protein n=1 Tax=Bacillus TaxID=1386 RepID=UPI000BFAA8B9|nr:hypothetical protein [Bacillus mycoides]PGA07219.1 hypothetical protein COL71_22430 [Bacillus mycoides]HDR7567587.1 hypothetical protein [Bacillus mycoides]HDR7619280.1 hypothetical protein [Bacillus mycoides]